MVTEKEIASNFIHNIIARDLAEGKNEGRVHTRFPPEPNGYLHIGHAKSIVLNYGLAETYGGLFNLRYDDTNPTKEEVEYVDSQMEDVRWLGADWEDRLFYASDYFEKLYEFAVQLIEQGKAYVCDLTPEEMKAYRGTLTEPGRMSPFRERPVEENLDLFKRMRAGEFPNGARTLRAKIDMSSPNINMRDPVVYRIMHADHHRTGDEWCIYPMYDYAHPLSDALESITHSICTLEYADHRPLYDWFLENIDYSGPGIKGRPHQIEFARLNLNYTVISKRKLLRLVQDGIVKGWDDPRMPTLSAYRRRGYTPESIRDFCERVGVARTYSVVDVGMLEHCIREDLNKRANRVMAVLQPLKVILTNYPENQVEWMEVQNHPGNPEAGERKMPFSRELFIEQDDFMEDPPGKFFRLKPGGEIRLIGGYIIKCEEVVKDKEGDIIALHCTYDPGSKSGGPTAGRKVKGTCHWVSAHHAVKAEVRLYDRLFTKENPEEGDDDFMDNINPESMVVLKESLVEPSLVKASRGERFQFMRQGYFNVDPKDSTEDKLVFNRIVTLRDTWAKLQKK